MNTVSILQSTLSEIYIEDYNDYCKAKDSFITITLKPEEYKKTIYTQLKSSIKDIEQILKMYCSRAIILPELTNNNNIHYHGIVTFNKLIDYPEIKLIDAFKYKTNIGFTMINKDKIEEDNRQRTWTYLFKDINKTISVIYHFRKKKMAHFMPYIKFIACTTFQEESAQNPSRGVALTKL